MGNFHRAAPSVASRRLGRTIELFTLMGLPPVLYVGWRPGRAVLPLLWVGAGVLLWLLLRDPSFDRSVFDLQRCADGRWTRRLVRWLAAACVLAAALAVLAPRHLWAFPRREPWVWAVVVVLYPILSVLPQTLVFRVFFCHRYAALFATRRRMEIAAALAFAWAHITFLNPVAPLLSLIGGWLFVRTFRESGSAWASAAEHAMYGVTLITLGWGVWFYHGTIATARAWAAP